MTKVIYYTTTNGNIPIKKFINSLEKQQRNKVSRIITYIELYGLTPAIPHIKKLSGTPLWEIRFLGQDNIRVFYVTLEEDAILILHGFVKKSQKTPNRELETALNYLTDWHKRLKALEN